MAKERAAIYVATASQVSLADSTGVVVPIDLRVPLGQAVRVIRAAPFGFSILGSTSGKAAIGFSLDPSEEGPASLLQFHNNLDVIVGWSYDHGTITTGAKVLFGDYGVDLTPFNVFAARNLSLIARNDTGASIVDFGLKILFRLVDLNADEMADILGRQR